MDPPHVFYCTTSIAHGEHPGPIATLLNTYPKVQGLVVGHFGEFSPALESLRRLTAQQMAAEYAIAAGMPVEQVKGMCSWHIRRIWAMTAIRANSRTKIKASAHVLGTQAPAFERPAEESGRVDMGDVQERFNARMAGGFGMN